MENNLNFGTEDIEFDFDFKNIYEKCRLFTMTSIERMYALYKGCRYILDKNIQGDFVECGVWKGGSAMLIAYILLESNATGRKIYLYDTFEGMAMPTEDDYGLADKNNRAIDQWKKEQENGRNNWCFASLAEVRDNMYSTGYRKDDIIFVKGKVEDTIPETVPSNIALLRLDTDWYESTKHELNHLFPILLPNGVLIIDDYGHWAGSKKAVDEYFSDKPMLLTNIDYTGVIGLKEAR